MTTQTRNEALDTPLNTERSKAVTDRETLDRLYRIEERAFFHAAPNLERATQVLEGRRRIGLGAAYLVLARDQSNHRETGALNSAGWHLRRAQQLLDRELAGDSR